MGEYWLHYVGRNLYTIDHFEKEAKHYSVQRAIPFHMIKNFHWGDIILLAHYSYGQAEVFGYFRVESVVNNLPEEVQKDLLESLDVVSVSSSPRYERRLCGGYFVGGNAIINDSIQQMIEKIISTCQKHGIDPAKHKWFLRGPYVAINSFILDPAKFTRSYMRITIEDLDLHDLQVNKLSGALVWIYDYKQNKYLRKSDLRAFGCPPLDDYL